MVNTNANILVVDDHAPLRAILSSNLRTLGFKNIKAVPNVQDAIHVLKTQPVTLVLTDWNMPGMTGLDLLKWIRKESVNNIFTPVIMITAEIKRDHIEEAISCGVTDFILKPFTVNILSERIEKAIGAKSIKPSFFPSDRTMEAAVLPQPALPDQTEDSRSVIKKRDKDERLTILAVDDTPDNLTLIANLFQKEYRVKIASNGEKAIRICESDDPPNLVLLDIMMPGMNGYDVIRRLKASGTTSEIPVIFITALSDAESIVKGLETGAVDYITKPIEPSVARARVRNFLRYHRGYRELKDTLDIMMENAKLREDMEHIVRHDMKGPLSSIISMVKHLIEQSVVTKKVSLDSLRMIEESAFTMLNMINLSTDLYKMETGQFDLHAGPVDTARLILRVTHEIRTVFASKNLSIINTIQEGNKTSDFTISGDELLCYSLLHNLIKNAAEASHKDGAITISTFHDDSMVKIAVHNDSAVPEPIRDRFFEKFVTWGKQGGTGLGTYSARLITEAQKGSIAMQTSEEEGTTIEVSLPRWPG